MDRTPFRGQEDAVSPVIGVVLLVAITVTLAATIAVFVLDVPREVEPAPSATFALDYQEDPSGTAGTLTLIHENGDTLDAEKVMIRGTNLGPNGYDGDTWADHGEVDASNSRITLGKSMTLSDVPTDFELRLVYDGGDTSTTLQEEQGPDA